MIPLGIPVASTGHARGAAFSFPREGGKARRPNKKDKIQKGQNIMMHIKVLSVSVAALAASAVIGAAYGKTVSLSPLGGGGAAVSADEGDTVKVKGRGVGTTEAEALKDAYRDAVERAVGLYVDAESAANNDELVEDKILTHSNAYIEKYDEIDTKKIGGGLIQIRIAATVKKRELVASLTKVSPSLTVNKAQYTGDLKDIHAQIVSKEKRDADGYKLLQNTLMGIDPCTLLAVPSVDMTHKQVIKEGKLGYQKNIPDGQVVLRLLLRLKFNEEKYFKEFVPVVKQVLDQIASSSKNVKLSLLEDSIITERFSALDDYLDISGGSQEWSQGLRNRLRQRVALMDSNPCMSPIRVLYGGGILLGMEGAYFGLCNNRLAPKTGCRAVQFQSGGSSDGRGWEKRNEYHLMQRMNRRHCENSVGIDEVLSSMSDDRNGPLKDQCKQQLILVCGVNKAHTVWNAVFYTIDKKSAAAFMLWCNKYGSGNSGCSNNDRAQANSIKYNVSYCDKSGDCVLVNTWHVPRVCIMNADWGDLGQSSYFKDSNVLYISPFLGCYSEEYVQWHDALIKTDMLQEIESVNIELDN